MTRQLLLGIPLALLLACADRPTAPNNAASTLSPTGVATLANHGAVTAVTASVTWEATAGTLVTAHSFAPIVATRVYGLLGIAQYGAAVAAGPSEDEDDDEGGENASPRAHYYVMRGAVAGASAQVLSYLFQSPTDVAAIESQVASEGNAGTPGIRLQFARGVAIGRSIGDIVVLRGVADGFANADRTPKKWDPTTLPTGPTIWRMDADATPHVPSGFQFPGMSPYFLTATSQFRPPPPPADLTPSVDSVITIVNARTRAQDSIAKFWNLAQPSVTALGYWDQQAASYISEYGLDERQAAHVFALVNAAGSDAILGCWEAKYYYLTLRPWMVAPIDLPKTKLDIGRPNHPSYPSGHSCVSSAAATVLEHFFPAKSTTLNQQVAEAGISRIYAGIHYFVDIKQGQALGQSVAQWAIRYDSERGLLSAVFPRGALRDQE